ncbi:MAG: hypothetical protein JNM94_16385 [Phycisphaerae bacterium]|nr:hypothetical protein [Phycisphaerae bacterium]
MKPCAHQDGRATRGTSAALPDVDAVRRGAGLFGRLMATAASAIVVASQLGAAPDDEPPSPVQRPGIPVETARFEVDGRMVVHGTFATNVNLDSLTIGEATYSREEGRLHEIVAVRVYALDADGNAVPISDEELANGSASAAIIAARDLEPWPSSAIDTLGGLSVATLLVSRGTASIRIDVLFAAPILDDKPGEVDKNPEAILIGPPPDGSVRLSALIAGDLDDAIEGPVPISVPLESLKAGRSNVDVILGRERPSTEPVAFVGYDIDEFGVSETPIIGLRLEIPAGVLMSCKLFAAGKSELQMLASADSPPLMAALGEGYNFGRSGGGASSGPLQLPPPVYPLFNGPVDIDGGGGGSSVPPNNTPVIPSPPAFLALACACAGAAGARRGRR